MCPAARPTFFPLPPLFFFFFFFFLSFLSSFYFLFSPVDRYRPLILDYFHRCARLPPPLPLPWQKNGNSRGPVHGFLVNFAANRRRPPMSTTRKNVLDRVTGQFLLRRRRGEKKKEACVYIYIYVFYIYICIFCSIGRRSGAILEIM